MSQKADRLLQMLKAAGKKPTEWEDVQHDDWNFIAVYYVNTLDYDPKNSKFYDKGLEIMHTEIIPLCAHMNTECYFSETSVEDNGEYMAEECGLDKVEPGYYKCVCGVQISDTTSTSWEGVTEYDSETYYYMLSRTKMSSADVDYIIETHKVYPSEEEYAEIMANQV